MALVLFIFFVVVPLALGCSIAKGRNRSQLKAFVVVLFFGWIGVIALALTLKVRDPVTKFLK